MTNERAKSELEQLYMSLSEEKKKALDVAFKAMEQAIPEMYYPQVDGITPTVVAQADEEKTCVTCRNEDTYHCAECENKSDYEQSQADGEYISRQAVNTLIDELARAISDERCCISRGRSTATIMQDILDLPSVNPQEPSGDEWEDGYKRVWAEAEVFFEQEPKTGHWIIIDDCEKFIAKCSECGQIEDSRMIGKYAYCHCGARMIESQERSRANE